MPVQFPPPYIGGYGSGSWKEGERQKAAFGDEDRVRQTAALAAADDRVTIPIAAPVDSLNVTVAAGIALHALGTVI